MVQKYLYSSGYPTPDKIVMQSYQQEKSKKNLEHTLQLQWDNKNYAKLLFSAHVRLCVRNGRDAAARLAAAAAFAAVAASGGRGRGRAVTAVHDDGGGVLGYGRFYCQGRRARLQQRERRVWGRARDAPRRRRSRRRRQQLLQRSSVSGREGSLRLLNIALFAYCLCFFMHLIFTKLWKQNKATFFSPCSFSYLWKHFIAARFPVSERPFHPVRIVLYSLY